MDLFRKIFYARKIFEAMQQAKEQQPAQAPQPAPAPVVVGRLTDEEILRARQIDALDQEMKDLAKRIHVKHLEKHYRMEALYTDLRERLGITFASMTKVTEDYLVEIPRDEAAKHGVISE